MAEQFPYQVVAFLDEKPEIGESAYNGTRGWFAQIALKRRFTVEGETEREIVARLQAFSAVQEPLVIEVGDLIQPDRMPVRVLQVAEGNIRTFHENLIRALGSHLRSRYPDRDGEKYLPHVTAEYNNAFVIDVVAYRNRTYMLDAICLLKDVAGSDDAVAHTYFRLGGEEAK